MLGMIVGSFSIILVVTVGLTGKKYALDQISGIGPNMIEMQYVGGTVAGPDNTSSPDSMTREDMAAVIEQVPGIIASSPMLEFHDRVSMGSGITKDTMLLGVSPQYKQVRNLKILAGRSAPMPSNFSNQCSKPVSTSNCPARISSVAGFHDL